MLSLAALNRLTFFLFVFWKEFRTEINWTELARLALFSSFFFFFLFLYITKFISWLLSSGRRWNSSKKIQFDLILIWIFNRLNNLTNEKNERKTFIVCWPRFLRRYLFLHVSVNYTLSAVVSMEGRGKTSLVIARAEGK